MNKELKLIGKGSFTKAYLRSTDNRVVLESSCPIKECMALGWFPKSRLFPKIEFSSDTSVNTYEMEYYPKVSSLKQNLKPQQWEIYKQLRALDIQVWSNRYELSSRWYDSFKTLKNKHLSKIMIEALDACCNYGRDISFEISPRNVAVKNGNLILLDCFFSLTALRSVQSNRRVV